MSAEPTVRAKIVVPCTHGVHMRVASRIVQQANLFESTIELLWHGERSDARSVLGMLKLGAVQGAEIEVVAQGPDAAAACRAIVELFKSEADFCGPSDNESAGL